MGLLPDPVVHDAQGAQRNWNVLGQMLHMGVGNPNGIVPAPIGAVYFNRAGGAGAALYVKETGEMSDTGWVAK